MTDDDQFAGPAVANASAKRRRRKHLRDPAI